MNGRHRLAVLFALALLGACREAPATGTFEWPLREGWRKETIPFPLEFARELPFSGVEELRFAPGMFKPEAQGFWSYAFAWWLDGQPPLGASELERALLPYFAGLITEVAKEKRYAIDPARFSVSLHPSTGAREKAGHAVQAFTGSAELYDAFATGKPITLNLEVWVWDCAEAGKRVALVLASPKPSTERIWEALRERRDEFACHGAAP